MTTTTQPSSATQTSSTPDSEVPAPTRVLIVDDHVAVRLGLQDLLAPEPDLEPVAYAPDLASAIEAAQRERPDVAIVDYSLGAHDGLLLCRLLGMLDHPPRVLIFSAYVDERMTLASIVAGADGILSKGVLGNELVAAARAVAGGEAVRPPLSGDALERAARLLDPRDVAILATLVRGVSHAAIAEALGIGEGALAARRWAMLERLREPHRPERRAEAEAGGGRRRQPRRRPAAARRRAGPATARTSRVRSALQRFRG